MYNCSSQLLSNMTCDVSMFADASSSADIHMTTEACEECHSQLHPSYLVDVKTPNTNRPLGCSVSSKNTLSVRGNTHVLTWIIASAFSCKNLQQISHFFLLARIAKKPCVHDLLHVSNDRWSLLNQ